MEAFIFILVVSVIWLFLLIRKQKKQIRALYQHVMTLTESVESLVATKNTATSSSSQMTSEAISETTSEHGAELASAKHTDGTNAQTHAENDVGNEHTIAAKAQATAAKEQAIDDDDNWVTATRQTEQPLWLENIVERFRDDWMLWTGAISVALAGIFVVLYAISSGLLGPYMQFGLSVSFGLGLHGAAHFLRHRDPDSVQVFAGLAAGGSITLYSSMLAGLHYFALLSPGAAFLLLAVIAIATMALSLTYGPVLAIIGMLGAYIVPLLMGESDGQFHFALVYVLIITYSSLFLLRYVERPWLWWGVIAGVTFWWWAALAQASSNSLVPWYLSLSLLAFVTVPKVDNRVDSRVTIVPSLSFKELKQHPAMQFIAGMSLMTLISVSLTRHTDSVWYSWLSVLLVSVFAAYRHPVMQTLPWISGLVILIGSIVAVHLPATQHLRYAEIQSVSMMYLAAAVVTIVGGSVLWTRYRESHLHSSFAIVPPLLWLTGGYIIVGHAESSGAWAASALLMSAVYAMIAYYMLHRDDLRPRSLWPILGLHASYSLAASIWFEEASLTTALSIQLISLAMLNRRYDVPFLGWLLKGVLAIVVLRLTVNPWLMSYDNSVHWSLWTYGAAFICSLIATRITLSMSDLRVWLEAASLHLFVLFAGAELRYALYDGDVFAKDYGLVEASTNAILWGALALVYRYRSQVSTGMNWWYSIMSRVLTALALLSYATLLLWNNPIWSGDVFSTTPVFNLMTLAYGGPLAIAIVFTLFSHEKERIIARATSMVMAGLLVALTVRHFWQDGKLSVYRGIEPGEWYSYSAAAIIAAMIVIFLSLWKERASWYRFGSLLMGLATLKIFISDMSGLDGLWRAASFLGLGLALLGMTWLYRRTFRSQAQ